MFDPDRDDDGGSRRFYLRLLVVVAITSAGCVALLPAVNAFRAGDGGSTMCLAVLDGWHSEKAAPSGADVTAMMASMPRLAASSASDPGAVAQYRAEYQAWAARPDVRRVAAYDDWVAGPGTCIGPSRHLLIHSGIALGALALVVAGGFAIAKTRRIREPST